MKGSGGNINILRHTSVPFVRLLYVRLHYVLSQNFSEVVPSRTSKIYLERKREDNEGRNFRRYYRPWSLRWHRIPVEIVSVWFLPTLHVFLGSGTTRTGLSHKTYNRRGSLSFSGGNKDPLGDSVSNYIMNELTRFKCRSYEVPKSVLGKTLW